MPDFDAGIVGSGVGGMSAALELARRGRSVVLLESSDRLGGLIRPYEKRGYSFDVGVHYIGKAGPGQWFRHYLDQLGLGDLQFIELDPDGFDRYLFPEYEFRFCRGRDRLVERLTGEFPLEAEGIAEFFDTVARIDDALIPAQMHHRGLVAALRYLRRHPVLLRLRNATFDKILDRTFADRRLKAILCAPLFDLAISPARASAIAALSIWGHFMDGAYYPRGGSRGLRRAFLRALRGRGVSALTSSPVRSLDQRGGDWKITLETGQVIGAGAVVSAVDPTITLGVLVDPELVPRRIRHKTSRLHPSLGVFFAHIGTDLDLPALGITSANIATFSSFGLDRYYRDWAAADHCSPENGIFMNSPSVRDPRGGLAPEGRHSLEILGPVSYDLFERWANRPPDDRGGQHEQLTRDIGERLIAVAERQVPGLSAHLDFVKFHPPLFVADRTRAVRGGIYGPEHTPDQMGYGRFPSLECGIDGLYLAGAGTMGAGVALCCASGVLSAQLADDYLRVGVRPAHRTAA